jgi:23S rRNA (uracil1939-C5)-methyltransferase
MRNERLSCPSVKDRDISMTLMTLQIDEWDKTGRGVGDFLRPDGKCVRVAVQGSIVGEIVEADFLVKNKKAPPRFAARTVSISQASPYRAVPLCPHAGECGGCVWQHMTYEHQLQIKQDLVAELFTPLCSSSSLVQPIIGCDIPWQYRNKMEFSFSQDLEGHHFLGLFHGQRRRCVLDLKVCYLTGEWMSKALESIKTWWKASGLTAYRPPSNTGSLICVTMRESATFGDRMIILTVSGNPDFALKRHHLDDFVSVLKEVATPQGGALSIILRIRQIAKKMPTQIYEMILFGPDHVREMLEVEAKKGTKRSLELHISPQAFFQPNTCQAMKIYSHALQMASLCPDDVVFDLYCGIGVFGMFAALEARTAVGVELSRDSAYDAKTNAERLCLSNFSIQCGDTAAVVAKMKEEGAFDKPAVVIVDPPRAGLMPSAIEEIVSLEPKTIVYVSCNPESQCKDATELLKRGWIIASVQPVDQFPHTFHVENILLLKKGF